MLEQMCLFRPRAGAGVGLRLLSISKHLDLFCWDRGGVPRSFLVTGTFLVPVRGLGWHHSSPAWGEWWWGPAGEGQWV